MQAINDTKKQPLSRIRFMAFLRISGADYSKPLCKEFVSDAAGASGVGMPHSDARK
jgi:hypothetical protein